MMKSRLIVLLLAVGVALPAMAGDIALPAPNKTGGMPLMEALAARKSDRRTAGAKPTPQQLSDLLWAANGVSRADGKRTAPSAMNRQEIELAVLTADGLYAYDPVANLLRETSVRVDLSDQLRGASALVVLHYDSAKQTRENALTDVGFVGQNLYLFCASKGWPSVFLGTVDRVKLATALGRKEQEILYTHRLGVK